MCVKMYRRVESGETLENISISPLGAAAALCGLPLPNHLMNEITSVQFIAKSYAAKLIAQTVYPAAGEREARAARAATPKSRAAN